MKKLLALILVFLLIPYTSFAEITAEQLDKLSKAERTVLKLSLSAKLVSLKSVGDGVHSVVISGVEYDLSLEEMQWIVDYLSGTKTGTASADTKQEPELAETPYEWMSENNYNFPIYGTTSANLTPISDYLSLLEENGIYISLPELTITNGDEYDWIYSKIGEDFYLTYLYYHDGSKYTLKLEVPRTYRPCDSALTLLIVSMLSVDMDAASKMYNRLQYNIIDDYSEIVADEYTVSYWEPGYSSGNSFDIICLSVEKKR